MLFIFIIINFFFFTYKSLYAKVIWFTKENATPFLYIYIRLIRRIQVIFGHLIDLLSNKLIDQSLNLLLIFRVKNSY